MGTHNLIILNGISSPWKRGGVKQERPMKLEGVPTNILAVSSFNPKHTVSIDLKNILSTSNVKIKKFKEGYYSNRTKAISAYKI